MATQTWGLQADTAVSDANFALLDPAGAAASGTTLSSGWTPSKTAPPVYARYARGVTQASGAYGASALPAAPLVTTTNADTLRTPNPLTGTYDVGNWIVTAKLISSAASGSSRVRVRVYKSAAADGTGLTELTSAAVVGTTYAGATTEGTSVCTWAPGTTITLAGEYLYVQLAHEIVTAGATNNQTTKLRSGGTLVTPNFTPGTVAATGTAGEAESVSASAAASVAASGTAGEAEGASGAATSSSGSGGTATPTFVQGANQTANASASLNLAFPAPATAGSLLVASVSLNSSTGTIGVTDNLGNAWTLLSVANPTSGTLTEVLAYLPNAPAGVTTVKFTTDVSGKNIDALIAEFSGVDTGAHDASGTAYGTGTSDTVTATTPNSQAVMLVLVGYASNYGMASRVIAGYTGAGAQTSLYTALNYKVTSAIETSSATGTSFTASDGMVLATFRAASTGPSSVAATGSAGEGEGAQGSAAASVSAGASAGEAAKATGAATVQLTGSGSAGEAESATGTAAPSIAATGTAGEGEKASGSAAASVTATGSAGQGESASGTTGAAPIAATGSAGEGGSASGAAGASVGAAGTAGEGESATGAATARVDASGSAGEAESAIGAASARNDASGTAGEAESASGTATTGGAPIGSAGSGASAQGTATASTTGAGTAGEGERATGAAVASVAAGGTAGAATSAAGEATPSVTAQGSAGEAERATATATVAAPEAIPHAAAITLTPQRRGTLDLHLGRAARLTLGVARRATITITITPTE